VRGRYINESVCVVVERLSVNCDIQNMKLNVGIFGRYNYLEKDKQHCASKP
jgi:hypothetical protein